MNNKKVVIGIILEENRKCGRKKKQNRFFCRT